MGRLSSAFSSLAVYHRSIHGKARVRPRLSLTLVGRVHTAAAGGRLGCVGLRVAWEVSRAITSTFRPSTNGGPMATNTLADLYTDELKDLYSAEQQILKALPKMIKAARHDELKHAFETHRLQTEKHVERLVQVLEELGESPKGKKCRGMEGVLEEGDELIKEDPEPSVLDAGLISKAQHVEHYEMAGYGSVCTWATLLGHDEQASLLRQTLEEEKATDALLSDLAMQSINLDAEVEPANEGQVADLPRSRAGRRSERGESDRRPRPEQR